MGVSGDDHGPAEGRGGEEEQTAVGGDTAATDRDTAAQLAVEWLKSVLIAVILFFFIRTFLVEAYRIPTGSMENSLLTGDFLLVNKAAFGAHLPFTDAQLPAFSEPERGDIVVFVPPHADDQNYVKRLVGAPGDTVEMRNKALYLNGVMQRESYARYGRGPEVFSHRMDWQCDHRPVNGGDRAADGGRATDGGDGDCRPSRDSWGPIVVPAGRYMMLGDNRDKSEDSRYWGFIDRASIKGSPLVVYYSFDPDAPSRMPWFSAVRWRRIGDMPH